MSKKNDVKKSLSEILKSLNKSTTKLLLILFGALLAAILLLVVVANAEAEEKKSAMFTAKFGGAHNCSLQHLGKNLFITATHCVEFIFIEELPNLVPIQIKGHFGLFKVVYYTLDRGITLTDGLAVIEIFMIDFSDHDIVIVPKKYTEPTNLHCYPGLRNGRLVNINGPLTQAKRLSKTRIVGMGDVGPGCSGGAWLANGNELVGITSSGWGGSGLGSAVVTVEDSEIIDNIIRGHRPELGNWDELKKQFRPEELKRRTEDAENNNNDNVPIRIISTFNREGESSDKKKKKKKQCTKPYCKDYSRPH